MAKKHLCSKKIISLTFLFPILLGIFLVTFLLIKPIFAQASVIYVDSNAAAGGDGSSWASAFTTIQEGLNAADAENFDVWVAKGTYYERITLRDGVKCYGGFAGTETGLEYRNYENNRTIIDGQRGGSVVTGANNSRIDGFTIKNGYAQNGAGIYCHGVHVDILNNTITSNEATSCGGGIFCSSCSPFVYNNKITQNTVQGNGGGVYGTRSSCIIRNNTINYNNASNFGGGIFFSEGSPTAEDNTISRNTSDSHGGGIYSVASSNIRRNIITKNRSEARGGGIYETGSSVIEHNRINDNYAVNFGGGIMCNKGSEIYWNEITANRSGWDGGGIYCIGGSFKIKNNHIVGNISDWRGGGIYCDPLDSVEICNCLIAANRASWWSGILLNLYHLAEGKDVKVHNCNILDNHSTFYPDLYPGGISCWNCTDNNHEIKNCIIRGNGYDVLESCSITYSNIEDGNEGLGNISKDPLSVDTNNGDYHLNPNSPCIDAGDPDPRFDDPDGTRNNMGIYGGPDYGVADGSIPSALYGIIFVNINAPPGGDGRSWEKAYKKIQTGLDMADDYNEDVWVAQGTYYENIILREGVALYGGFSATETEFDQRDFVNNETIIDGQYKGSVVTGVEPSMIDGFTIKNGRAQYGGGIYCSSISGGLYIYIQNNIITSNEATDSGGGFYSNTPFCFFNNTVDLNKAQNSAGGLYFTYTTTHSSRIENNTITRNEAVINDGGGIFLTGASSANNIQDNFVSRNKCGRHGGGIYNLTVSNIRNNIIAENISFGEGGGIYETGYNSTIEYNTIKDNYATKSGSGILSHNSSVIYRNEITANHSAKEGGGICSSVGSPEIANNHIISNISDTTGGGICCRPSSNPNIRNNLVLENQAVSCGAIQILDSSPTIINNTIVGNTGGICADSHPLILNCILWANGDDLSLADPDTIIYSDIEDGDEGQGNINENPLFVDPENGDYHLDPNSPCIDMGNPQPQYNDKDWTRNDMGCYGWSDPMPDSLSIISVSPSTLVDFGKIKDHADRIFTVKNTGPGTLSGTASTSSPFSIISGGSYNLAHGESQDIIVRFSPTQTIFYSKTVSFTGGGGATRTVTGIGEVICIYSISPTEKTFDSAGGAESIMVTAPEGCLWEAVNNDPYWITITSDSSGSGTGSVNYTVDGNPGSEERTGTIYIAGETFQINQGSSLCNAVRSAQGYMPSISITIKIDVIPPTQVSTYAVEDTPPDGWLVDTNIISYFGEWDNINKKVKWGPFFDNNTRTLTYEVTPPSWTTGCLAFSGSASFDGYNQSICGDVEICEGLPHPSDTSGDWQLSISEISGYGAAWKKGEEWPVDPNPIPINYVTRAGYIWMKGEIYHYILGQSPPFCWELLTTQPKVRKREILETSTLNYSFDPNSYIPGQPITVAIEITPVQSTVAYAIEDAPPDRWQVDTNIINYEGEWDNVNKKVKWGPFFDNQQRTFTYKVTPPPNESGTKYFHGVFSADGAYTEINGQISETVLVDYYLDYDGDGYGDKNDSIQAYTPPSGYIEDNTDCNDNDVAINPDATESCDGEDNDCDDNIDEEDAEGCRLYYKDADKDRHGVEDDSRCLCGPDESTQYTTLYSGDPDDSDPNNQGSILTRNISFPSGWSMISLLLMPEDASISSLFPEAEVVYGYQKEMGYVRVKETENLEAGKGYWILLNEATTFNMTGGTIDEYNLSAQDGWYMIGGCTFDSKVSGDNCNIGVIYGYEKGSGHKWVPETENLEPGKGYWILLEDVTEQANLSVQGTME